MVVINRKSGAVVQRLARAEMIAAPDCQRWPRYMNENNYEVYIRRDAIQGTTRRIYRISSLYPGIARTNRGITIEQLSQHSLVFPAKTLNETDEFLFTILIHLKFEHNRHHQQRGTLSSLIVIDEGLLTFDKNANRIEGPVLSSIATRTREYGMGIIITSSSLQRTDQLFQSNTSLHAIMGVTDGNEATAASKILSLSPQQREYLDRKLAPGQVILKTGEVWKEPMLATFPNLNIDKSIAASEWEAAVRRTRALAPPEPPPTINHATNKPSLEQPVALNKTQEALLRSIGDRLRPETEHYAGLGIHPQTGTRAMKQVVSLGLARVERIVVRPGRGDSTNCPILTKPGYERLNSKSRTGTRGGDSIQHQYLVQEYARLITTSSIETKLGEKSIDLVFRYDPARHDGLASVLDKVGRSLTTTPVTITSGLLCALEVEVSDPLRTGITNVIQNHDAGIALNILAVMPAKLLEATSELKERLDHGLQESVIVAGALEFLQALRQEKDDGVQASN